MKPEPVDLYRAMMDDLVEWGYNSDWVMKEATIQDFMEIQLERGRKVTWNKRDANKN